MKRMNYVSAQLMKGRDRGVHKNYMHRLYAEGLEDLEKKQRQVCSQMGPNPQNHDCGQDTSEQLRRLGRFP